MTESQPRITGIVETAISATDVGASVRFYQGLFGFENMVEDGRFCAFNIAPAHVLLIFLKGGSIEPVVLPDNRGTIPPHDSQGQQHFALGIPVEDFDAWCDRLRSQGIAIESIVHSISATPTSTASN
ncbi:MAG: VOC family protein [Acidobacteriota bacterium]